MSYLFAFSYCSWVPQGKNTEVVCHSLLQWTTFCQTSPPWPFHLGWPHMVWLSFIELDKAAVHVIRLTSCLWLWFQSVCPLMPSLSAYCLTWVSLTLDMGYLFTTTPEKCSLCSWSWSWRSSSEPLLHHIVPDVQASFRQGRGTRDQIANICWIIEKAREFQKNICFCSIDYAKAFDCGSQ